MSNTAGGSPVPVEFLTSIFPPSPGNFTPNPIGAGFLSGPIFREAFFRNNPGAAPSVILSVNLNAGWLGPFLANGQGLRMKFFGATLNNANPKTVRLTLGALNVDQGLTVNVVDLWIIDVLMLRRDATNFHGSTESRHGVAGAAITGSIIQGQGTSFVFDPSIPQAIVLSAQVGAAADVEYRGSLIELIP